MSLKRRDQLRPPIRYARPRTAAIRSVTVEESVNRCGPNAPAGRTSRERRRIGAKSSILWWCLLWVLATQSSVIVYLEWRHPEFFDPKYGCRIDALRFEQSVYEGNPLVLTLGSSRAEQGFRPSQLPSGASENHLFFYNLARGGSSPLLYLLTLRRLLADGIHPDFLLVEIFPPALSEDGAGVTIYKPTLRDVPLLWRYSAHPRTWGFWLQDRLLLWYKYRNGFLAWIAPQALPRHARWGDRLWNYQGGEWRVIGEGTSAAQRRRLTDDAHRRYFSSLQHLHVAADADRALRELLGTCRTRQIGVVLFLMPEAGEFRGWYPPETQARLAAYLEQLQQEYRVPLIDARRWIADDEFSDAHHLLAGGAAAFTQRFANDVAAALHQGIDERRQRRTP
jgi:hypothetical protein